MCSIISRNYSSFKEVGEISTHHDCVQIPIRVPRCFFILIAHWMWNKNNIMPWIALRWKSKRIPIKKFQMEFPLLSYCDISFGRALKNKVFSSVRRLIHWFVRVILYQSLKNSICSCLQCVGFIIYFWEYCFH